MSGRLVVEQAGQGEGGEKKEEGDSRGEGESHRLDDKSEVRQNQQHSGNDRNEQKQNHKQEQEQIQDQRLGLVRGQKGQRAPKLKLKDKQDQKKWTLKDKEDEEEEDDEEDEEEEEDGKEEASVRGSGGAAAGMATPLGEEQVRGRGSNSLSDCDNFRSQWSFNPFISDNLTDHSRDTYPPRSARRSVSRMMSLDNGPGMTYSRQGLESGTSPTSVNVNFRGKSTNNSLLELDRDREVFVEVTDLAQCQEKLLRYKLVVITGPPGQGSKTLAYAVCRAMQRKFKREKIKVKVSNSWNEWDCDPDKAQIVLINNMFGSFEVAHVEDWCKLFAEMKMCIHSSDKLYHVITCKSNILKEVFPKVNGKLFSDENIFRITTSYTEEKKKQFIANHANRANLELSQLEVEHIARVADDLGFPKCCQKLLKRGTNKAMLPMRFKHPTEVYMQDLCNVPRNVMAMLLLLMLDRPRSTCLDSTTRELTDVENTLLAAAGVQPGILVSHLLIDARMFEGVYIEEDNLRKTVDFVSDNVLYSVFKLFFIKNSEFLFKHCKLELLDKMVRVGTPSSPLYVVMTPDQFVFFSDRCLKILFEHEEVMNICLHPAFLSDKFIDAFFDSAGGKLENLFRLKDRMRGQTWLYWSIWSKSGNLCRKTLSKMSSMGFTDHTASKRGHLSNVEETIVAACVSRNTDGLSALIKRSYNSNKFNTTRYNTGQLPKPESEDSKCLVSCDTIIEAACKYGSPKILQILIKERSKIANQADFTALFQKCVHYNMDDALQVLLTQLTEDTWVKDELRECLNKEFDWAEGVKLPPLHFAIIKKFQDIARTLLENGSGTESFGDGLTATQTAWENGNIEMFDHLVGYRGNFDFVDSSGEKPLEVAFKQQRSALFIKMLSQKPNVDFADDTGEPILHACQTGDLEMAKMLVECRVNLNVSDSMERTPLHLAALKENSEFITILCTSGNIDVNAKDINGCTALHLACDTIKPNFPHITELLKFKPQIDARNNYSETPLHVAWKRSNITLVKELVEHGANCNIPDGNGNTLIHFAAEIGDLELLKTLLEHDANAGAKNRWNQTPLHIACKMQKYVVLSELLKPLKAIEKIDAEDDSSFTPLHVACSLGNIPMAMALISKGANINVGKAVSPVQITWGKGNQMLFQNLVRLGGLVNSLHPRSKSTPLHDACETDDGDMVIFLLQNGADVNIGDGENQTPLHICCKTENIRLAKKVLNPGNINVRDIHGKTALYKACETGNIQLVEHLAEKKANITPSDWLNHPLFAALVHEDYKSLVAVLQNYGFNINAMNNNGESILFYFCREGRPDIVTKLLSCGANPTNDPVQSTIKSPLYAAVIHQNESIFEMLLRQGDARLIDKPDQNGDCLLHVMCSSGNLNAVKMLLAHGADVNLKNKGKTQLHLVCERYATLKEENHIGLSLLEELVSKGADINAVTEHGSTSLHILSEGNNVEMLKTLLSHRPNVNIPNNERLMPLHVFLRSYIEFNTFERFAQFLKALLNAEVNVNAPFPNKLSPVHMVVKDRRSTVLKILLQYNPNLEIKDLNGDMPVHVACRLNNKKMVTMLLEHQDHLKAVNSRGRYPLHVACEEEAMDVLQVILNLGADPELQTKEDKKIIPLDIAVAKTHFAMAEKLLEFSDITNSRVVELYRTCRHGDLRQTMWRAGVRTEKQIACWCLLAVLKLVYVFLLMFIFVFVLDYPDIGQT